jgi:D-serine deaminase-like pyridoxal phosphate-dependent protein
MGHQEGVHAMLQNPPAEPGMREEDIDTPALVIDLDAFEHNLDTMAALLAPTGENP